MTLFYDGNYKIFSTVFSGQDADLLGGRPTAVIAGYHNNTDSSNMVWKLSNIGYMGNQFTLQNQAPSSNGAYAGVQDAVSIGAQLHGSTTPLTWTAFETCIPGQYMLLAPAEAGSDIPTALVWSLDSGSDGTPISLQILGSISGSSVSISGSSDSVYARAQTSQAWNFLPWK